MLLVLNSFDKSFYHGWEKDRQGSLPCYGNQSRRKKIEFKRVKLFFKIDPVSHPPRAEGLGKYIY